MFKLFFLWLHFFVKFLNSYQLWLVVIPLLLCTHVALAINFSVSVWRDKIRGYQDLIVYSLWTIKSAHYVAHSLLISCHHPLYIKSTQPFLGLTQCAYGNYQTAICQHCQHVASSVWQSLKVVICKTFNISSFFNDKQ